MLHISVTDTGIGIAATSRPRSSTRSRPTGRRRASTAARGSSHDLGATGQDAPRHHVDGERDRTGEHVHVTVPMRIGTAIRSRARRGRGRAARAPRPHRGRQRDEPADPRRAAARLAHEAGRGRDGAAALAAMRRTHGDGRPFPLALLDGHMPEMDGFELANDPDGARARRDLPHPAHVLGQAGRPEPVSVLGVAYLMKPIMQAELLKSIEAALGSRPGDHRPPRRPPRQARSRLRILLAEDTR